MRRLIPKKDLLEEALELIKIADVVHHTYLNYGSTFCNDNCLGCDWEDSRDAILSKVSNEPAKKLGQE